MKMNMLLFVWTIIFTFISCHADDSGEGSGLGFFFGGGDDFKSSVFDEFDPSRPDRCPCTPRGPTCDILATCQADACDNGEGGNDADECDDLGCAGIAGEFFVEFAVLFCGNEETEFPESVLTGPVFGVVDLGPFGGICVSSRDGILGVIRAIIETILEFLDELEDCFDDRRRLQDGTSTGTTPSKNPFHGSPLMFENFVQVMEWKGNDRNELLKLILKERGIAHLAGMMKQQAQSGTTTRRLLSDDSGEGDFGICDFGFLFEFLGGGLRRRLNIDGPFNPATDSFEFLLSELFTNADCEATPIICMVKEILEGPNRRILQSDDSDDSGDSGDGDDDDSCCDGNIGTSIQWTTGEQAETCSADIFRAGTALNRGLSAEAVQGIGRGCDFIVIPDEE